MSPSRRNLALALAALGAGLGLGALPASAGQHPGPACPNPGKLMIHCGPGSGSGAPVVKPIDPGIGGHYHAPWWKEAKNHGPFPPHHGRYPWPRRGGPLGPPF